MVLADGGDRPKNSPDDSVERVASRYDAVPYSAFPYPKLQPARMAATAHLLGLKFPPVETARTLEIGCATGAHLIPLAQGFPHARFLGLDVSPVQIETARSRAARLGLANITFDAKSFTELKPSDGPFDYIVCHGVYSWISPDLRRELLRNCAEYLAPEGIALISFNVFPGWRMFQIVRDCMLIHAGTTETPESKVARMRSLADGLEEFTSTETSYGHIWRQEAQRVFKQTDAYLLHELLEEDNAPCTITEFAQAAASFGMTFLAEANVFASCIGSSEARVTQFVRSMANGNALEQEQYFDMVTGRSFRQTLLVHAEHQNEIDRTLSKARLDALHFISPLDLKIVPSQMANEWTVDDGAGTTITTTDTSIAGALGVLIGRLPSSTSFEQIRSELGADRAIQDKLRNALLHLIREGVIEVSAAPVSCANTIGEYPMVWPLAASDATADLPHTATLRHSAYEISPKARFLMPLADGTRNLVSLCDRLSAFVIEGGVQISESGVPITDPRRIRAICAETVNQQLAAFARAGLLVTG